MLCKYDPHLAFQVYLSISVSTAAIPQLTQSYPSVKTRICTSTLPQIIDQSQASICSAIDAGRFLSGEMLDKRCVPRAGQMGLYKRQFM